MIFVWPEPEVVLQHRFGLPLHGIEYEGQKPDAVVVFETEMDRQQMGAQFFFDYITELRGTLRIDAPENVIVIGDGRLF